MSESETNAEGAGKRTRLILAALPLTIFLGLATPTEAGVPARWWTRYFNSSEPMIRYAAQRGVPAAALAAVTSALSASSRDSPRATEFSISSNDTTSALSTLSALTI